MVSISLPDGKIKKYKSPVTGNQIAKDIAPSLLKKALVVEVNGEYKDLNVICSIRFLVLCNMFLAFPWGPGGFRKLREAKWNHFHLS